MSRQLESRKVREKPEQNSKCEKRARLRTTLKVRKTRRALIMEMERSDCAIAC